VIVTELPTAEPPVIDGLVTSCLYEHDKGAVTPGTAAAAAPEPVVFILDYICESPIAATISALNYAAKLARNKRRVYYLARFIRTAGYNIERLYKEAREAGVTFIKYDELQISADLNEEAFNITASDGYLDFDITFGCNADLMPHSTREHGSLVIKTKIVYSDGGADVGERFAFVAKKLNLTTNKFGYLTEDRYYLTPALTSRRGVYHLTRDLIAQRLDDGLDYIFAHVFSGIWEMPLLGVALIDGKKCIFCYNCYRACPHAALEPDSGLSQMQCLPNACAGCGACVSICPANAITLDNDVFQEKNNTKNKSLVMYCENSVALDEYSNYSSDLDFLSVPCGNFIDTKKLSDELVSYEKVLSIVCHDDSCRHFDGNKRACAQTKRLLSMLEAAGLSTDKIRITQISQAMPEVLREEIVSFLKP